MENSSRSASALCNVPFSLHNAGIRGILLDIEGTTTPIRFVYDTLFPYARFQLKDFLQANGDKTSIQEIIRALKKEWDNDRANNRKPPDCPDNPVAYVHWLMDQDRKSTALKTLQGVVWQEGYQSGKLHGEIFPDVAPALQRWRRQGFDVRIFSSGSVLAQKLLFGSTPEGDLTRLLNGYFDTTIGAKAEPSSYAKIAGEFGYAPHQILFISDVTSELDAARTAGMKTLLSLRPGNPPQPATDHPHISSFEECG
jgi:enolase-phosphatase E1